MSIYSNLKFELMVTGQNASTWGDVTNTNLGTAIEQALAETATITFASNNVNLSPLSDTNGLQDGRALRLNLTGTTGGARNLTVPAIQKPYIVNNGCADPVTVKTPSGTGIAVPAGKTMWVYSNGTDVVDVTTHLTSLTLGSPLPVASGGTGSNSGNAGSLTGFNASNVTTGTLAVAYGGTGSGNAAGARVNLLPSYTGNGGKLLALNSGATDVEWISAGGAGTVTSVNANSSVSGLSFTGGPITSAGTLTLSGTLGVQGGGTGTTSLTSGAVLIGAGTSAITSVSPGTNGNVLSSNGSAWVSQAPTAAGVSSLTAGTGIALSGSTGAITITNTGAASISAGTGISVSAVGGAYTVTNSGVTQILAGSGISVTANTGSITISSSGGGGGTVALNDGSVSSPSLYFTSDTNTGLYRVGTDELGIAAGGARVGWFTTGTTGIALGQGSLASVTSGTSNVAIGGFSGGTGAGGSITTGSENTCIGGRSPGYAISTGSANTCLGSLSMDNVSNRVTGNFNTGIGYQTYASILSSGSFSGANTTCLGYGANPSSTSVSNEITLGNSSIATLRCQVTTITSLSDARDKTDIAALDAGLNFINALNPVRFTWDMRDPEGKHGEEDTGFIAQDLKAVQEQLGIVIPGLVYDNNPEKLEAGYGKLLPVLVKAIQELSAKVDALEAQLGG